MAENYTRHADDPTSEILATSGLVTIMGAVVAAVVAVVTLGQGDAALAAVLGTVAVASFVASLACFFSDSNRAEEMPLPFPSRLRSDAKAAQELSA